MRRAACPEPPVPPPGGRPCATLRGALAPSVLWLEPPIDGTTPCPPVPGYFSDLNLDQVVQGILAGLEGPDLRPVYYRRLSDEDEVRYRQEVFADLEKPDLLAAVVSFAGAIRSVLDQLATADRHVQHVPQAARWHLDAAWSYVEAVEALALALVAGEPSSRALGALSAYAGELTTSEQFCELRSDCARVRGMLASICYCVHVRGGMVTVTELDGEPDCAAAVQQTFERFRQGASHDYRVPVRDRDQLDHVETQVLDRVASLFTQEFRELETFCEKWREFVDPVIDQFGKDVHFYLAYLAWTGPLRGAGLPMCYPQVARRPDASWARDSYDLVLGRKLVLEGTTVVTNEFSLHGQERILVVTGPNQGGKTTFARMFGQLHHLAALGCPVPGTSARLRLADAIFTCFPREEDPGSTGGRLEEDVRLAREILASATADSVLLVNEIFTATTLQDAAFLGRKFLERACEIGLVGVCVTFVDELASSSSSIVSMVSTVEPDDPSVRTFRVSRRAADGRSYALAIAQKYGLRYEQLVERLSR